jgi:hypothetical protein
MGAPLDEVPGAIRSGEVGGGRKRRRRSPCGKNGPVDCMGGGGGGGKAEPGPVIPVVRSSLFLLPSHL